MTKTVLSRKAVLVQGAAMTFLAPMLAQDAKIDLTPILAEISAKNFKDKKPAIIDGIRAATKDKLAKDASIDGVVQLLDALEGAEVNEGADADPNTGLPMATIEDRALDDDPMAKVKEFLKGKLNEADQAAFDALCGGASAMDEDDEEGETTKVPTVTKPAMDAAIEKAKSETRESILKGQREVRDAEKAVRPYIGELALAIDSAEEVYRTALTSLGVDLTGMHPSAFPAVLKMQPLPGARPKGRIAEDASPIEEFNKRHPDAFRIRTV